MTADDDAPTTTTTDAAAGPMARGERPSAEQIAEIRRRCNGATPAPWGVYGRYVLARKAKTVAEIPTGGVRHGKIDAQNARFIAHARTDVPLLLAENDALRAELLAAREREDALGALTRDITDAVVEALVQPSATAPPRALTICNCHRDDCMDPSCVLLRATRRYWAALKQFQEARAAHGGPGAGREG